MNSEIAARRLRRGRVARALTVVLAVALPSMTGQSALASTPPLPTRNLVADPGFESAAGRWQPWPGSNIAVYQSGQVMPGERAHGGQRYAATNTTKPGGGIYQDIGTTPIDIGDTVCASAYVRTEGVGTGATGQLNVWLLGGGRNETAGRRYGPLGNFDNWTKIETCVTATTPHSMIRIQFYADALAPTVNIDDVDVHVTCSVGFCHDTIGVGI
jgi:hypothetical protein